MVQQQEAKALVKKLGDILSESSVQDDLAIRKEAIRLSRALTLALDESTNTATELAFSVQFGSDYPFLRELTQIALLGNECQACS